MVRYELALPEMELDEEPILVTLWLVQRGGRVWQGDPIVEVASGSVVVDLPSPGDGVLTEILVAEDEPVRVGQTLAVIEAED